MNDIPETLNFEQIYHGMIGRDFIVAFNNNFNIADTQLIYLLGQMIYRIKSSDIKAFRVNNGVVQYSLDEESWVPVSINEWGSITGSISNQTDLKEALDNKAALETVNSLSTLVNSINLNLSNLTGTVEANTRDINTNSNNIADILTALTTKVYSTTIKEIRINDNTFQWSPDGINWYQQSTTTSIDWGSITGDITEQTDLYQALSGLDSRLTTLEGTVSSLNTSLSTLSSTVSGLNTTVGNHTASIAAAEADILNLQTALDTVQRTMATAVNLNAHINDTNNPHNVTKAQLGLGNVDNTADVDKPVSTPQSTYIDNRIDAKINALGLNNVVTNVDNVSKILFTNSTDYFNRSSEIYYNMLAFVNDNISPQDNVVRLVLQGTGTSVSTDLFTVSNTVVTDQGVSKLKYTFTSDVSNTVNIILDNVTIREVKNNLSINLEDFTMTETLAPGDSYDIFSSLSSADVLTLDSSTVIVTFTTEEISQ